MSSPALVTMIRPLVRASLVAFIASFCTLVIEIVAGRILAPHVGVSLYTWTSIIGVVLAGISLGAYAGGWIADRRPVPSTLGWLLLASGVTALAIGPAADNFAATITIGDTLPERIVVLATLLFFLPSFFLGMISPVAVKLAVRELDSTGRVVGKIYAFSTLGSIAGTFTTGFYLVAAFGTRATMLGVGVALILTAFLLGDLLGRYGPAVTLLFVATLSLLTMFGPRRLDPPRQRQVITPDGSGQVHFEESQYYTISVEETVSEDGRPLQSLHLDHLAHSYSDLKDATFLSYHYLQVFNDIIQWKRRQYRTARLLFIGGGGYTLPRLTERTWPEAEVDVAEIDPAVTRVAQRFFDVSPQTAIRTINQDARWFAMNADETYDLIFIDAFNDLSVPYHLTTREYTQTLRDRLTRDGVIAANVIDNYARGHFLASYVKTLQAVFGSENVAVVVESDGDLKDVQSTYVVLASPALSQIGFGNGKPIPHAVLQAYVRARNGIVLTDDYVPVDNMLAPLFAERYAAER